MNTIELFEIWFVEPLTWLKSVPENNGSFVALATALYLYEQYFYAKSEIMSKKGKNKKAGTNVSQ